MRKTQLQLYYQEQRRISERDQCFMEMINNTDHPIANRELELLVERRPEVWGRYRGFLGKFTD